MRIMSTGMFDTRHKRFVRHVNRLVDRQGIHVGAQRDYSAGLPTLEQRYNAMLRNIGSDLIESERSQSVGNHTRRALLVIRKLGVHVKIAASFDEFWPQC